MTTNPDATPGESGHKLVIERELRAPRELVWKAWTDPAHVKQWLSLAEEVRVGSVQADLRAGGKFRIQQQIDGEYYTVSGTYLEVIPGERFVYTWDWEKDGAEEDFGELEGDESQVTVEFFEDGPGTKLVLTHERFSSAAKRDRHEGGWKAWIIRLTDFVEGKSESTAG